MRSLRMVLVTLAGALLLAACGGEDAPAPVPPRCGDGKVDPGESCDDGNDLDTDACRTTCVPAICGDGKVFSGTEACDDGNFDPGDACTNGCQLAKCGDGIVRLGQEACDDGDTDDGDGCTSACKLPTCGDGIVQAGEGCDDGNAATGDACLPTCLPASCGDQFVNVSGGVTELCDDGNQDPTDTCVQCKPAQCGDGVVQAGVEACDDGNGSDTDGCTNACKLPTCGDGLVQKGELCDDGNQSPHDACLPTCLPGTCGDGILQLGGVPSETCDDGNQDPTDGCTPACQANVCGDGLVWLGVEACDDGNASDGDGCTNACKLPTCGDGVVGKGEACDDGNAWDGDACTSKCLNAKCGDGLVQPGEACDDGGQDPTDGCLPSCQLAKCGDGAVWKGHEACDDGNTSDADQCTTACKLPTCGDGVVQAGEACDDGNGSNNDACTALCLKAACGDGYLQAGEGCDDGNASASDGCLPTCQPAKCGDGVVQAGVEGCDDGNGSDTDGCTNACKLPSCGDGLVQKGEGCDDGNGSPSDGCLPTCQPAKCGDGFVNQPGGATEACDDGNQDSHDACLNTCQFAKCGDGIVQAGVEGCDDGNGDDTDGCTNACKPSTCGDGVVAKGEGCDDGNLSDSDACLTTCVPASCGDGKVQAGKEACDDGNFSSNDACLPTCQPANCGDGKLWLGKEACDDGNTKDGDGCGATCLLAKCGDGKLDPGEGCDDGNPVATDACTPLCQPAQCGDGLVWSGVEACDDGNLAQGDGCTPGCQLPTCGDGVVQAPEACDDGNATSTDGCTTTCKLPACGDGLVWAGKEACDDGNASSADACTTACQPAKCGDGYVQAGVEACDDGNPANSDACLSTCQAAVCGDGHVWQGVEPCDDGNADNTDGCLVNCETFDPCKGFVLQTVQPAAACLGAVPASLTLQGEGFLLVDGQPPVVQMDGQPLVVQGKSGCELVAFGTIERCSSLTVKLPGAGLGPHTLTVTNVGAAQCPKTGTFTVTGPPIVSSVTPTPFCEGTATFDVQGSNFAAGTQVTFGPHKANAVSFIDASHLQVTFVGLPPGVYDVTASNGPGCSGTKAQAVTVVKKPFAYFLDPAVVWNGIGVQATLYVGGFGAGVLQGKPTSVGVRPTGSSASPVALQFTFSPLAPKTIGLTVPSGLAPASYEVVIADNLGCVVTLPDALVVTATQTLALAGIDPPFGKQGQQTAVVLSATAPLPSGKVAFQNAPTVYFSASGGGLAAPARSVAFVNQDRVTAVAPSGLPVGKYDLIVINPDGAVGVLTSAFTVTQAGPPVLDAIAPGSVPTGGTAVAVLGSGLSLQAKVTLLCKDAAGTTSTHTPTVTTPGTTQLTIQTPDTLTAGLLCVVRVQNPDGTYADYAALGVTAPSENLSDFTVASATMTVARRGLGLTHARATATARFLYAVGGDDGTNAGVLSSVEAVPVDPYGELGTWRELPTPLPAGRSLLGVVSIGRYVYVLGGRDGSGPRADVWRAQVLDPADAPQLSDVAVDVADKGLTEGVWYYRVAAKRPGSDADNPGGLTLPTEAVPIRVPKGLQLKVDLAWQAQAGATGYLVYRSEKAGLPAGQEQLLAELPASQTTFSDTGAAVQGGSPRQLGDLGAWKTLPSLDVPREGLAVAVAADPVTPGTYHLYALLGRTLLNVTPPTLAWLTVQVAADGSNTDAAAWKVSTKTLDSGRWQVGAMVVDRTVTTRLQNAGDAWLYVGNGLPGNGNNPVDDVDGAQVLAGGDVSTWKSVQSGGFKDKAGYAAVAAANQLFVLGGANAAPSTGGVSGQLCGPGGPCTSLPGVKNFNAGIGLAQPRYLMGVTIESGRIFVAGGQSTSGATNSVESTVW